MAEFTDLMGQYLSNRIDRAIAPIQDPMGYLNNRVQNDLGIDANVAPQVGPTVAASQGNQPGNPLNIPNPGVNPNQYVQEAQQLATEQPQPVAPDQVAEMKKDQVAAATAPAVPAQDYNAYIARQESGAKPEVGYHYPVDEQGRRASTAYGTYGITAPAYKDIQAADPYFANRPITSLTKEDQARANIAYRDVLSKQLEHFGVEPTEANIRGAHLAGARGLADYLQKGTVSPEAAAANGGEAKFRQILTKRLGGEEAPASGAENNFLALEAQRAHADQFHQKQNDMKVVSSTAFNEDADPATRMAANDKLVSSLENQRQIKEKSAIVDAAMADPSGQGALKMMNQLAKESNDGSILKAIFYSRVGLNELAQQEQRKLGSGDMWQPVVLTGGKQGWIKTNFQGAPIKGYTAEGEMSADQLINAPLGLKGAVTGQSFGQITAPDGSVHTISHTVLPGGRGVQWRDETSGEILPTAPAGMTHLGAIDVTNQKGLQSKSSTERTMRNENTKAIAQGARPRYTEEQIVAAGNNAYQSVTGKPFGSNIQVQAPAAEAPQTAAPAQATTAAAPAVAAPVKAALPPDLEAQAQSIARGETEMPKGTGAQNYRNRDIIDRVYAINPSFDPGAYKITQESRKNWTQPNGKGTQQMQQFDRAASHVVAMGPVIDNLNNTNSPIWNKIVNDYKHNTGQAAPADFSAAKKIVADEIMKTVIGGAGTGGEREALQSDLNAASSPAQLKAVVNRARHLMAAQGTAMERQYQTSTKLTDFQQRLGPAGQALLTEGRQEDERIRRENTNTRSKW